MTADNKTTSFVKAIFLSYVKNLKGVFSGLRQFLATENPLKIMKNVFYLISEALSVLKIFKFLIMYQNGLIKVNFKFYDVTAWSTNHCNTHIAKCLGK